MFSAELEGCDDIAFLKAGEQAFAVLRGLIEQGVARGALRNDADETYALIA